MNFLPSSSVNFLEMWMPVTFDEATTRRELEWASAIGFNAVRTNLHYLAWKHDREGLLLRFRWFVELGHSLGIKTVPVLFDDCGFGGFEPAYATQPDPVPGLHNSRAVASPGREAIMSRDRWPGFKAYLQDIVGNFADDPAILFWDLYNEPGQLAVFSKPGSVERFTSDMIPFSRDLMLESFVWAREMAPSQPLTVGAWATPQAGHSDKPFATEIDQLSLELSDIITFHAYCEREQVIGYLDSLAVHDRPLLNTEWMARPVNSTFVSQLTVYEQRQVGCFSWGLVQGRSQTHLPWPQLMSEPGKETDPWFHDLLWPDGTPYDPAEVSLISALTGAHERSR